MIRCVARKRIAFEQLVMCEQAGYMVASVVNDLNRTMDTERGETPFISQNLFIRAGEQQGGCLELTLVRWELNVENVSISGPSAGE